MKTTTKTLSVALAMMATLTIGSTFGQDRPNKQSTDSRTVERSKAVDNDDQDSALAGVWEEVSVPATVDCQTGQPNGPIINALLTFNQGGTMSVEEANQFDGPYRASALGIWKRTSGRNYTTVYTNYAFNPDKTLAVIIKQRTNIRLHRDGNSFTEHGTFEVRDPNGNLIDSGCFADTPTRLQF